MPLVNLLPHKDTFRIYAQSSIFSTFLELPYIFHNLHPSTYNNLLTLTVRHLVSHKFVPHSHAWAPHNFNLTHIHSQLVLHTIPNSATSLHFTSESATSNVSSAYISSLIPLPVSSSSPHNKQSATQQTIELCLRPLPFIKQHWFFPIAIQFHQQFL